MRRKAELVFWSATVLLGVFVLVAKLSAQENAPKAVRLDSAPAAKEALTAAQTAVQGAQRDMLATREGQRYQETVKALQALQKLLTDPKAEK